MSQEIWDKFPKIMHYTNFYSLKKIIRNKTFKFSHYTSANDEKELQYSKNLIKKHKWELLEDAFKGKKRAYPVHCACFCEENNEFYLKNGRLSQWRGYGKKEPIAIIFNTKAFSNSLNKNRTENRSENRSEKKEHMIADKVRYHICEHDLEIKFNDEIPKLSKLRNELECKYNEFGEELDKDQIEELCTLFMTILILPKHKGFEEEKEVRFVLANNDEVSDEKPRYLEFDLTCIDRIIVGPTKIQSSILAKVKKLFHSENLSIDILKSDIPFKGLIK